MSTHTIRSGTVLPARREDVELHTADGLRLVGELALPLDRDPVATLVTLHPLPTHGGFMDSHVFRKAAWRLPALAGLAVLRFNLRGVSSPRGTSEGTFDAGDAERLDVAAAIEFAEFHDLPRRWLLGWSFGTDLALMHGCDPSVEGAVLLSPPLRSAGAEDLNTWAGSGKPVLALVPELDDYLRPEEATERFRGDPAGSRGRGRGCQAPVGGGVRGAARARRDRRRGGPRDRDPAAVDVGRPVRGGGRPAPSGGPDGVLGAGVTAYRRSCRGITTSWTTSRMPAAIGMPMRAPIAPISVAPISAATRATAPGTDTVRAMIFGAIR